MATKKVVTLSGLSYALGKEKTRSDAAYVAKETGKSLLADTEATRLEGMETGAQVNIIESISVNGTAQTVTNKGVNIDVPTNTNQLTNGADFATNTEVGTAITTAKEDLEAEIAAAATAAYKAKGSVAFASLPAASKASLGDVYNISDDFTTTAQFVEGAGKTHPAGTNVVIVELTAADDSDPENPVAATYGYDVFSGMVDLSAYAKSADFEDVTNAEIDALFA